MGPVLAVIGSTLLVIGVFAAVQKRKEQQGDLRRDETKRRRYAAGRHRKLPDYSTYDMSRTEQITYIILTALFLSGVAYVFYRNIVISVLVMPLALLYPKYKSRELMVKRKQELNLQFKDALYSLSSSVSAGKSIELAFKDVAKDLSLLYPDPDAYIIREFTAIAAKIEMNMTVENALADFARRADLEDIASFADVFAVGKRSGGNMAQIIKNASAIIGDKLRIKEEIDTLLAQRKLEQKVLNVMPVALVLLLSWSTGDYMSPVFHTFPGRLAMSSAVILLAIAYLISKKIMDIEV